MKKNILITTLLMLVALTTSAQKLKEGTSAYFADKGQKCLKENKIDEAKEFWKKAKMAKQISVEEICLGGDIARRENDLERAKKQYQRAIYFNRHDPLGYYKLSKLYDKTQLDSAVAVLDSLNKIRPDLKVPGLIADLYWEEGLHTKAIALYDSMQVDTMSDATLSHYSVSAFFTRNYDRSIELSNMGHIRSPRNLMFNRMRLYSYCEREKYPEALSAGNDVLYNSDSLKAQYLDYQYMGYSLYFSGRKQEGLDYLLRAGELVDPEQANYNETMEKIAAGFEKIGRYDMAAKSYESYVSKKKNNKDTAFDTYKIARYYYLYASSDSTLTEQQKTDYLNKSADMFKEVSRLQPNGYLGYYWTARVYYGMDADMKQGLAKPYYAKVIELCENDATLQGPLIEALKYMSYYFYVKKNTKMAHEYAEKILDVDPMDSYALSISEATR